MKILELRFKNLNSLYGEWFIDFTDPEYVSNGIFALTGPTGAGKSTILDAICLALYGATPRLGKITKNSNEVMSRQTGECFAEVMFESQVGRFRCYWAQHRARKKADGCLADAKHEISNEENGELIETKKNKVLEVIEAKTGMDFDRFTRSILLAQGGFDTFLKADIEQKSKLLEQITGTEIYSRISQRVHEKQRLERESLDRLQAEIVGVIILDPSKEYELKQDLEVKQKQEVELAATILEANKAIDWLTSINKLKKEMDSLLEESEKLYTELECFKPQRERLIQAMNAVKVEGDYATLSEIRKQQEIDQISLRTKNGKLPELEASFTKSMEFLKKTEQQTLTAKAELEAAIPVIQRVRSLDQSLADQKKTIEQSEAGCKKEKVKIEEDKYLRLQEQDKYNKAHNNVKVVEEYLTKHSQDEWLVSGLAGIEEQIRSLQSNQRDIAKKVDEEQRTKTLLEQISRKLEDCICQHSDRKQKLQDVTKLLKQAKQDLHTVLGDRLLREYRTEKETLLREMTFFKKIEELKDHRSKLEDGKPCPLCGAKEHPFAEGNIPVPDEIERRIGSLDELIQKAENQESVITKLEHDENKARMQVTESENREATAANEKKSVEKRLADVINDIRNAQSSYIELIDTVSAKLQPLGIEKISAQNVSSLLSSLNQRMGEWLAHGKKKNEIEKQLLNLNIELRRLDAVIQTQSSSLVEKQETLDLVKKEYEIRKSERMNLFGSKNPEIEERQLNKAIVDAEQIEKQALIQQGKALQNLNDSRNNIADVKKRIENRMSELKKMESDFIAVLQIANFTDEKQFLHARLDHDKRDELELQSKDIDHRQTDLRARQKDRESRLVNETVKKLTERQLEELVPHAKEREEHLKQIQDEIAGLKHRLAENTAAKGRIQAKQASIEMQKKECHRWEKLHDLIGSADGKKYRNFAQGITFELMVWHANRQLEKMTERYLLIRDSQQPLELNVIDNYQAGEIRSTKNLSGGESFIVSLTLALGLSKMASRNVRVDSLFLDEGFGTLDEEALEIALETISGLRGDGKLIGIISHISALKERISTQITITPIAGGKSTLTGPGCSKIVAA